MLILKYAKNNNSGFSEEEKKKITMLTVYDYPSAKIVVEAKIDGIMDEMLYHTRIVSRAVNNAMVVGDRHFMSYQASVEEAVRRYFV
jgi:3-methyl-2-oxobutanoate hydroxymethyltransferase